MKRSCTLLVMMVLCAVPVLGQTPSISVQKLECVPVEANAVINANLSNEVGGTETRIYFRWDQHGAMYFVDMVADGGGKYWGLPAKPEDRNEQIEFYVAVVDPKGKTLAKSETQLAPVREDCRVELTPKQVGVSNNLTVGETVAAQQGRKVLGFLCDGVVTRMNYEGILRPDEICRGCVVPFFAKETYIAPAILGAVSTIVLERPPGESSPSRP